MLSTDPSYWARNNKTSQRNILRGQTASWKTSSLDESLQATGCGFSLATTRDGFSTPGCFVGLRKFQFSKSTHPPESLSQVSRSCCHLLRVMSFIQEMFCTVNSGSLGTPRLQRTKLGPRFRHSLPAGCRICRFLRSCL